MKRYGTAVFGLRRGILMALSQAFQTMCLR